MYATTVSRITTQYQKSVKVETVYSIANEDGRFAMKPEPLAALLTDLISCQHLTHIKICADGPLVIHHDALDTAAIDRVESILSRHCTIENSLRVQLDDLSQGRKLPEVHVPTSPENW